MKAKPGAMVPQELRLAHLGSCTLQGEATSPHGHCNSCSSVSERDSCGKNKIHEFTSPGHSSLCFACINSFFPTGLFRK